jgi:hypothetical protein
MATTTPNFGWPVPTSTDLVKDGATAIEALGDGVDASLVDLKGGTTGQVLAKTSATDLDFTWVTTDDANAIQNSIVDAKGDLIAASAADTPARLPAGNNGESLVCDSSTSTGLRYQPSTGRNFALNTDFTIFQRGTSVTPTANGGAYTADRWYVTRGSNTSVTVSQQTAGNLSVTPNQAFRYFGRVLRTAASTTTSEVAFGQMFETSQVTLLAGQTVTLSGYIRKGANFSATSDALVMSIIEGTGTDQKQMDGGYTGQNTVVTGTKTLTTSWQRFSVTGTIATTSTEITIKFSYTPTGTAGAADNFDIVGVQLELGSVATAWNLAMNTLQGELAAAMRYYERQTATAAYGAFGLGKNSSTTNSILFLSYKVRKRITPSSVDFGNLLVNDDSTGGQAVTALTFDSAGTQPDAAVVNATIVGGTNGAMVRLSGNNNTAAFIGFNSEL